MIQTSAEAVDGLGERVSRNRFDTAVGSIPARPSVEPNAGAGPMSRESQSPSESAFGGSGANSTCWCSSSTRASGLAVLGFVLFKETATDLMRNVNDFLWTSLGWAYLLVMFTIVAFVLFLISGPWGTSSSAMKAPSRSSRPSRISRYCTRRGSPPLSSSGDRPRRSSTTTVSRRSSAPSHSRPPTATNVVKGGPQDDD